jgi:hypothetical protein
VYGREVTIGANAGLRDTSGEPIPAGELVLDLGASGWTYHDVFVLNDRETGSLWYPYPEDGGLRAIVGPLEGRVLKAGRGELSSWEDWSRSSRFALAGAALVAGFAWRRPDTGETRPGRSGSVG